MDLSHITVYDDNDFLSRVVMIMIV
jgi:hypothetical protein